MMRLEGHWRISLFCLRLHGKERPLCLDGQRGRWRRLTLILLPLTSLCLLSCAPGPTAKPPSEQAATSSPDTAFTRAASVVGSSGMVVSAHPLASRAGIEIMERGGNAADAALATVAALNVVEAQASGLGGGGFLLYYDAEHDSFSVIDFRERAPRGVDISRLFPAGDTLHIALRSGATSVLVPGAPAGWQAMHSRWGTRLLPELFASAIALADTGYPVSEKQSAMILDHLADMQADSTLASVFLSDSLPLAAGARLVQPRLAQTLQFLSRTRLENLYYPPFGDQIVGAVQKRGGFLTAQDLQSYRVRERTPLRGSYHGYEIVTLPPPSSGGSALLEILRLVEPLDLRAMGHMSAEYIHALACASRQALKDADTWVSDPDFRRVPTEVMLSDDWISEARSHLRSDSVAERITAMDSLRAFGTGNTTHLVVVDSAGNVVSLTQSINYFFGSGVMVPELGLLMNNHMGDFAADSTSARAPAPLHRPPSNMAPTIVRKDGKIVLVIGSPGGPRIAPILAQDLVSVLDFGLPLDEALNAPRFFPAGSTLVVETRIPEAVLGALSARGWRIYPYGSVNAYFGGVHAIQIRDGAHELVGAADPRRDGAAIGY